MRLTWSSFCITSAARVTSRGFASQYAISRRMTELRACLGGRGAVEGRGVLSRGRGALEGGRRRARGLRRSRWWPPHARARAVQGTQTGRAPERALHAHGVGHARARRAEALVPHVRDALAAGEGDGAAVLLIRDGEEHALAADQVIEGVAVDGDREAVAVRVAVGGHLRQGVRGGAPREQGPECAWRQRCGGRGGGGALRRPQLRRPLHAAKLRAPRA